MSNISVTFEQNFCYWKSEFAIGSFSKVLHSSFSASISIFFCEYLSEVRLIACQSGLLYSTVGKFDKQCLGVTTPVALALFDWRLAFSGDREAVCRVPREDLPMKMPLIDAMWYWRYAPS